MIFVHKLSKLPNWVIVTGILLLTTLVYTNIITNKFVWDDLTFIIKWPEIRQFELGRLLAGAVPKGHEGVYRPLRGILYAISYHLYGLNPVFYKIQSIVLHVLGTYLVYDFVNKLLKRKSIAYLASLVFGLHPVHTENVAFTTASFDLLAPIFFLTSSIFFLEFLHKRKWYFMLLAVFSGFLSFLGGEAALILPFTNILIYFFNNKDKNLKGKFLNTIKLSLPFFALLFVYVLMRVVWFGIYARGNFDWIRTVVIWIYMVRAVWRYVYIIFFPYDLNVDFEVTRDYTRINTADKMLFWVPFVNHNFILGVLVIVTSLILLFKLRKKRPWLQFCILWFYVTLLPFSNLIPVNAAVAERYLYLPSIAFCLGISYLIVNTYEDYIKNHASMKVPKIIVWSFVVLIIIYSVRTVLRNTDWKDGFTLWLQTTKVSPESAVAWNNLGSEYNRKKEYGNAMKAYEKVKKIDPNHRYVYRNIATIFVSQGQYDVALDNIKETLKKRPNDVIDNNYLSHIYARKGEKENAVKILEEFVKKLPNDESFNQLGNLYISQGNNQKGYEYFKKALDYNPRNAVSYNNIAVLYLTSGKYTEAVEYLKKAIYYFPDDPEYYYNIGGAYKKLGDDILSKKYFEEALRRAPEFEQAKVALETYFN